MARPKITDNPVFAECEQMLEPLDRIVDDAKLEAARIVSNAKMMVKAERLKVVQYGIRNGLSQYAIGRLMGVTTAADQRALMQGAMSLDGELSTTGIPVEPAGPTLGQRLDGSGWVAILQAFEASDKWVSTWLVRHPDGDEGLFTVSAGMDATGNQVDAVNPAHHEWKLALPEGLWGALLDWRPAT